MPKIIRVSGFKKFSACICDATVIPNNNVIILAIAPCAVSDRPFNTPHSFKRLPNIRKPTKDTEAGEISPAITVMMIGNRILVVLETSFGS